MLKFGPDPVNVTFCNPPVPLSAMFIVADSGPYTLGVRLTLIVQVSSGEIVAGKVEMVPGLRQLTGSGRAPAGMDQNSLIRVTAILPLKHTSTSVPGWRCRWW